MVENDVKATNVAMTTPVAENESAQHLFVDADITISRQYDHSSPWNKVLLTNSSGDIQSIPTDKFLHMCEQLVTEKKFVQTIQTPCRGTYQGKEKNNPDIKIMGNVHFKKGYVLLESLQSKDGGTAISSPSDVHKRSYFKIKETVLFAYYEMFTNEIAANERLSKLALERSVNLSECISL